MNSLAYVGMDVHKETIAISVYLNQKNKSEFERVIRNTPKEVKSLFSKLINSDYSIIACYEAGPAGFTIYRQLEELGITCYVIAPSLLPRKPGDRIKTDKRDADRIARCLRNQEVTPIYIPTPEDESVRDYLRMYCDFKEDQKRTKMRLLHFLNRLGKKYDQGNYWTDKHRNWLRRISFSQPVHQKVFNEYFTHIEELDLKMARFSEQIEELSAQERYRQKVAKLRCFKGIDTLTALTTIIEIGDFKRFPNAPSFMAFLGLVPSEYSSGSSRNLGGITKAGNSRLRKLLIESSWHYRSYLPSKRLRQRRLGQSAEIVAYADKAGKRLSKRYNRLVNRGKVKQKVVTAIARELAGFIWGMMEGKTLLHP